MTPDFAAETATFEQTVPELPRPGPEAWGVGTRLAGRGHPARRPGPLDAATRLSRFPPLPRVSCYRVAMQTPVRRVDHRAGWLRWLIIGALVAGTLDILYAIGFSYARSGVTPPAS